MEIDKKSLTRYGNHVVNGETMFRQTLEIIGLFPVVSLKSTPPHLLSTPYNMNVGQYAVGGDLKTIQKMIYSEFTSVH